MIDVSCTQSTDQTITTVIARGAKIYGNELMENGYLLVPLFIEEHYQDLGITPNEYTIIRQLLRNYNQANQPEQMSVNLIATALRKSPATIRYHLRSLWRKGILLIRTSFAVDGSQLPNEYDISPLLVKLEQLLQQSTAPKELPPTVSTEQPETNQQHPPLSKTSYPPLSKTSYPPYKKFDRGGNKNLTPRNSNSNSNKIYNNINNINKNSNSNKIYNNNINKNSNSNSNSNPQKKFFSQVSPPLQNTDPHQDQHIPFSQQASRQTFKANRPLPHTPATITRPTGANNQHEQAGAMATQADHERILPPQEIDYLDEFGDIDYKIREELPQTDQTSNHIMRTGSSSAIIQDEVTRPDQSSNPNHPGANSDYVPQNEMPPIVEASGHTVLTDAGENRTPNETDSDKKTYLQTEPQMRGEPDESSCVEEDTKHVHKSHMALPDHAQATLHAIARELHDQNFPASIIHASKLYTAIVLTQQHCGRDGLRTQPDILFTRLIASVHTRLQSAEYAAWQQNSPTDGMVLFFQMLAEEVEACVFMMETRARKRHLQRVLAQLEQGAIPRLTAEEMVNEMLRLHGNINDQEVNLLLSGNASRQLINDMLADIQALWIQEIHDKLAALSQ